MLSSHLQKADPTVFGIIQKEKKRQKHFINLIPSENFTSQSVLDALGSVMQSTPPSFTTKSTSLTRAAHRQILRRIPGR